MDSQRIAEAVYEHEGQEAGRSLAALILLLTLVFGAYFALRVAMPELPLHVHQALGSCLVEDGRALKGKR